MTSRERVLCAIGHEEPDRVPLDYTANPEITRGLQDHYGLRPGDGEGLLRRLGVDFRIVAPPYIGPPPPDLGPDWRQGLWGTRMRRIGHGTGEYWDYAEWLLKDAVSPAEIDAFPWHPTPDMFAYDALPALIDGAGEHCVVLGSPGVPDLLNGSGMVMGPERVLLGLALEDEALFRLFDRRTEFYVEWTRRCLRAAGGRFDLFYMGEDLGSQRGPLLGLATYRRHIRPRHERLLEVVRSAGLPVMLHSCGSTRQFMDDFVDLGLAVLDTLQPEAEGMAPAELKAVYGERLAFHGMISTAGAVAYGTVDDVRREVTERLAQMMPGGGYCLAPTHALQSNSPLENVIALYDTAREAGRYR